MAAGRTAPPADDVGGSVVDVTLQEVQELFEAAIRDLGFAPGKVPPPTLEEFARAACRHPRVAAVVAKG